MPDERVRARLLDAVLPYVCGRRLIARGLDESELKSLNAWADPASDRAVTVSVGEPASGELVLLLFPGIPEPPALPGVNVVEVQYVFEVPGGLADDTAPATVSEVDCAYARKASGVWLDAEKPKQPLGCLVIASAS